MVIFFLLNIFIDHHSSTNKQFNLHICLEQSKIRESHVKTFTGKLYDRPCLPFLVELFRVWSNLDQALWGCVFCSNLLSCLR